MVLADRIEQLSDRPSTPVREAALEALPPLSYLVLGYLPLGHFRVFPWSV